MKRTKRIFTMIAAGLAIAAPVAAWSQSQGVSPGMMHGEGYGRGMMGGGYGLDMMDSGYGSGMMGSGYGAGMMGDQGFGMRRNCGPSFNHEGQEASNLTGDQQAKIQAIQEEFRAKQWELMGKLREQSLRSSMMGWGRGTSDETTARKAYDDMAALRKQMFENRLEVHKRIEAVLVGK